MLDAVIISDIHLGSKLCRHRELLSFLSAFPIGAERLIINGDLFEKKSGKVRCDEKIAEGALKECVARDCHAVVCGHNHSAHLDVHCPTGVVYLNSGCWTEENNCHYLTADSGTLTIHLWEGED